MQSAREEIEDFLLLGDSKWLVSGQYCTPNIWLVVDNTRELGEHPSEGASQDTFFMEHIKQSGLASVGEKRWEGARPMGRGQSRDDLVIKSNNDLSSGKQKILMTPKLLCQC